MREGRESFAAVVSVGAEGIEGEGKLSEKGEGARVLYRARFRVRIIL